MSRRYEQKQRLVDLIGPLITDNANRDGYLNWAMQASSYDDMKKCAEWVINLVRASVGVPNTVWDEGLANEAKAWAQRDASIDRMEHSTYEQRKHQGENLFSGYEGSSYGFGGADKSNGSTSNGNVFLEAVLSWTIDAQGNADGLSEKDRYDRQTGAQAVWKSTRKFGMGVVFYGDRHPNFGYKVMVCGRFDPAGNVVGQKPY